MKTAISMPDPLFREADELARRLGLARSELISRAVRSFVRKHRRSGVTDALNRVHGRKTRGVDRAFSTAMQEALEDEGW